MFREVIEPFELLIRQANELDRSTWWWRIETGVENDARSSGGENSFEMALNEARMHVQKELGNGAERRYSL